MPSLRWEISTISTRHAALRHEVAAADIDARGGVRAVRTLVRRRNRDVGARLELALVADHIVDDRRIGPDDDLLLAVLVLEHHDLAVHARHRGVDGRVRHRGVGPVPRPKALADAALRLGEDIHADRLLAAVGLRARAHPDIAARLDIGARYLTCARSQ